MYRLSAPARLVPASALALMNRIFFSDRGCRFRWARCVRLPRLCSEQGTSAPTEPDQTRHLPLHLAEGWITQLSVPLRGDLRAITFRHDSLGQLRITSASRQELCCGFKFLPFDGGYLWRQ